MGDFLGKACREILETGRVQVQRPDAPELLSIRNGAWTYDQIVEFADGEDEALNAVMRASKLPRSPNMVALDQLCQEIAQEAPIQRRYEVKPGRIEALRKKAG